MNTNEQTQLNTVRVSICIPAYGNVDGVRRLLESVETQSFTDYEIIVTDDSADDAVEQLVAAWNENAVAASAAGADATSAGASGTTTAGGRVAHVIDYIHNRPGLGAAANWNAAIARAHGEYVKILHHDDWFSDRHALQRFVDLLDAHPEADLAFCGTYQVPHDGTGRKARHISREAVALLRQDYRNLYLGNTIGAPSAVMVRRSAILANASGNSAGSAVTGHAAATQGGQQAAGICYDPQLSWLVDMDYYLQILARNPQFAYTEEPLISIGLSDGQLTNRVQNNPRLQRREYRYVYRKHHLGSVKACRGKLHDVLYGETVNSIASLHVGPISAGRVAAALFWLALTIEIVTVVIDKSNLHNPYTSQIFRLTFLMFTTSLVTTRYHRRELPYLAFFLVLGVVSWRLGGHNEILRATVFCAACVHRNGRRILQYMLWLTAAGCAALMALSLGGVYGVVSRTEDFGTGVTTRYCLGLGHPNALHCMLMMIVMLAVYLYDRHMRLWIYALLLAADVCLYGLTESATATAVWAADVLISALLHYNKRLRELDLGYLFLEGCTLAGLGITVWGAIQYPPHNAVLSRLDRLMTGRLASLWDTTFHDGTLSTWTWLGDRSNTVFFDLGWIRVIYWYGLIPAVIILCGAAMMLGLYRRRRDTAAWTFLWSCILYTLVEAHLVSEFLGRNPLLVLAAMSVPLLLDENEQSA